MIVFLKEQKLEILHEIAKETRKGRMADALAHGGDEGRDKLRKAAVRRKYPVTRRCPNGKTHLKRGIHINRYGGERRELKHLSTCRKRK